MLSLNFKINIQQQKLTSFLLIILFSLNLSLINSAYAIDINKKYQDYELGAGRLRACNSDGTVESLEFDPTSGGRDAQINIFNAICATQILTAYASVKAAIYNMNRVCMSAEPRATISPTPFLDSIDLARGHAAIPRMGGVCGGAVATADASFFTLLAEFGIVYAIANDAFNNTSICGSDWYGPNPQQYNMSTPRYKKIVTDYVDNNISNLNLNDKAYREYLYGGVEFEDSTDYDKACLDVTQKTEIRVSGSMNNATTSNNSSDKFFLDENGSYYKFEKQKYYLKGFQEGNYNCKKYLHSLYDRDPITKRAFTEARKRQFENAYNCCVSRKSNYLCLRRGDDYKFCQLGQSCSFRGIIYSIYPEDDGRYNCAKSSSLCPYNFTVGGGTNYRDMFKDGRWENERWKMITKEQLARKDCAQNSEIRNGNCQFNQKAGKLRNYCQYMTHCTVASKGNDYVHTSSLTSPYFSKACINFVGSSKNQTRYGEIGGGMTNFSAPIAQCIKETLENIFYNKVGRSICANGSYSISETECFGDNYLTSNYKGEQFAYKKGSKVTTNSFFESFQNNMRGIIKMMLTLAITMFGYKILIGAGEIKKKDLVLFVVKIAVISYFSLSDAWQKHFFDGLYSSSSEISKMVLRIAVDKEERKRDGCYFGKVFYKDGTAIELSEKYETGNDYLAIWDILDCKAAKYLGIGPSATYANIALLILAGLLTGPIGIYFSLGLMSFGIFTILLILRALSIFLGSCMIIILLVFISPIIFTLALFEQTKDYFKNWIFQLTGYILQPILLFTYISIFFIVMDLTVIGSATFKGSVPNKTISCTKYCINEDKSLAVDNNNNPLPLTSCTGNGQRIINPINDSLLCLIGYDDVKTIPFLSYFGIPLVVLGNLIQGDFTLIMLNLIKSALVMLILYSILNTIPEIATAIVGSKSLINDKVNINPLSAMKNIGNFLKGFQKRGAGAMRKLGGSAMEGAKDIANRSAPKDVERGGGPSGGDNTGNSSDSGDKSNTDSSNGDKS